MRCRPARAPTSRRLSNVCAAGSCRFSATRAGACTTSTCAPIASKRGSAATVRSSLFFFARGLRTGGYLCGGRTHLPDNVGFSLRPGLFALLHPLTCEVVGGESATLVVIALVHLVLFAHSFLPGRPEGGLLNPESQQRADASDLGEELGIFDES